jgi:hypothetical protein
MPQIEVTDDKQPASLCRDKKRQRTQRSEYVHCLFSHLSRNDIQMKRGDKRECASNLQNPFDTERRVIPPPPDGDNAVSFPSYYSRSPAITKLMHVLCVVPNVHALRWTCGVPREH